MVFGKDTQYDATWAEQDRVRRRQEIRARLKEEYVRRTFDPQASIRGEYVEDPAVERIMALKKNPPSPKYLPFSMFLKAFALFVVPMSIYGIFSYLGNENYEQKCRSGEIAYKDRKNKWLL